MGKVMKLDDLYPGLTIYDCREAGGLAGKRFFVWPVKVLEIDTIRRRVFVSWNYNKPAWKSESEIKRYRMERPQ
jgi:hypothetical protein